MRHYDVVIMGSGIAGGFLARQLRLTYPELAILSIEAADKIDNLKVGESTVEVAAHYMIRKLNLGTYLYQHQLPKNGLRFFFDREDKSLPITEMSEIGADHMPFHPSFQLERAALERDVIAMNRASGVEVELGAKVVDIAIDGRAHHTVTYEQGGARHEVTCRWLCDASGRRHLLHRKLGNKVQKETRLNTGAAWARYRNIAGLDAVTSPEWRRRVRYTSRHLSTNHFMYDGYWIWFIPLAGDLMSVGVVFDKDRVEGPRTREAFEGFLNEHRSSRDLMEGAVFEDFQAYAHLPYHSPVFFSADRWAMTGEAGAFVDPFYSPGSDFIATANEFTTALIGAELAGDQALLLDQVDAFNQYYRFKYESTLRLYIGQYPIFGSFEIFRLKYLLDFNNYYNLVVWPYMADKLTDTRWLRDELKIGDRVCQAISVMGGHFSQMAERFRASGRYFTQNEGQWANGLSGVNQFETRLGAVLDADFRKAEADKAFGSVMGAALESFAGIPGLGSRERLLKELHVPAVTLFKEISDTSLQSLLGRIGAKMTREIKAEYPSAGIERVVLAAGDPVIEGACVGGPEHAAIAARAKAMWDAEGDSLVHKRL